MFLILVIKDDTATSARNHIEHKSKVQGYKNKIKEIKSLRKLI